MCVRSIVNSFNEISFDDFKNKIKNQIKKEIYNRDKEYILHIDESEYIEYLKDEFLLFPLKILKESEYVEQPKIVKERTYNSILRREYEFESYEFTIQYTFEGSAVLFRVQPSSWVMTSYEIFINIYNNTVSFKFRISDKNVEVYNELKSNIYNKAFKNIENINKNITEFNSEVLTTINDCFLNRKEELKKENDFFSAINIKRNENTNSIFTVPILKKKIIPQLIKKTKNEFTSEPSMSKTMYNDILKLINDLGKGMERKPSLYRGKDEEQLRDHFVLFLETRYDAVTATGETFNREGKTDIILKYVDDGTNVFVAECKFWHGSSEFLKAISQLFDRYLTWRDSKTALILFCTNKDFSNVLKTIKVDIKNHPYYVKDNGVRDDSSFSYIFRLPQDKDKEVFLEVIAFHFDS